MITFYYFCLYVSLGDAYLLHPSEAHFVLWGDITNFDSLMLPADDEVGERTQTDIKTEDKLEEVLDDSFQMPFAFEDLLETNRDRDSLDSKDLDVATSDLYQAFSKWDPTQQYETDKHLMRAFRRFDGTYEGLHFRSGLNKSEMERLSNREFEMCTKVNNLGLQFLLHSRHKLAEALDQREDIRKDKRYRLGYLFNRLRRLTIEMKKVLGTGKQIERQIYDVKNTNTIANEKIRSLKTMLRLYEQMVRYDVDVRDTLRLIKAVFMEPADFNYPFLGYPTKPTTTTGAP